VRALLEAAIKHKGMAVLDIVSPCVTFNNAPDSTKSYPYGQEHEIPLQEIEILAPGYVPDREEITVGDYAEGEIIEVDMHDGTTIRLKKLEKGHDPRNRAEAIRVLQEAERERLLTTGLIYYEEPRATLPESLNLTSTPLAQLQGDHLRPSKQALDDVMKQYA
jgi:2-oxoglutarate ferredoxin oxidoreductase subunit beta